MKKILFCFLIFAIFLPGCSALKLVPADFAWPVENVLTPDDNGFVTEKRYSLEFSVANLFLDEYGDEQDFTLSPVHIIRNANGYYFVTSEKFKNVYIFEMSDGGFVLTNKILIQEKGIVSPSFNQRDPFIELLYSGKSLLLSENEINGGKI